MSINLSTLNVNVSLCNDRMISPPASACYEDIENYDNPTPPLPHFFFSPSQVTPSPRTPKESAFSFPGVNDEDELAFATKKPTPIKRGPSSGAAKLHKPAEDPASYINFLTFGDSAVDEIEVMWLVKILNYLI
jgi:hypothetical protein